MIEFIDQLTVKFIFAIFILLILILFRWIHITFYPGNKKNFFHLISPDSDNAEVLYLLSRIMGFGIIFSSFQFRLSEGLLIGTIDIVVLSLYSFFTYMASLYILENIVLVSFQYNEEIFKRKNINYALVSFAHATGFSYVIKTIVTISFPHILLSFLIWLFACTTSGIITKLYRFVSPFKIDYSIEHKDLLQAISYLGFFWGWCIILASSISHPLSNIETYTLQVIIRLVLSLLFIPLFIYALKLILKVNLTKVTVGQSRYGIYEGLIFVTASILSSTITLQISYGNFYSIP